jgi:DNA adenine methylase
MTIRGARRALVEHSAWKKVYRANPMPPGLYAHLSYLGGKWNCGKTLAKMIEAHRESGQTYIEPFVGGANVLWRISGKRVASDAHELLIDFWQAVQAGWYPDPARPTKAEYDELSARYKKETDFSHLTREERAQIVWTGYAASYMGAWFNGFQAATGGAGTKFFDQQIPCIDGVDFRHDPYTAYSRRRGCLIYCDPPYRPVEESKTVRGYDAVTAQQGEFDFDAFWDWAARVARCNTVLVSERVLPEAKYVASKEKYQAGRGRHIRVNRPGFRGDSFS